MKPPSSALLSTPNLCVLASKKARFPPGRQKLHAIGQDADLLVFAQTRAEGARRRRPLRLPLNRAEGAKNFGGF